MSAKNRFIKLTVEEKCSIVQNYSGDSLYSLNENSSRRSLSVFQHRRAADEGNVRPETAQVGNMLEVGTRKIFNSDHDILRESVRKFFKEEIVPHHAE